MRALLKAIVPEALKFRQQRLRGAIAFRALRRLPAAGETGNGLRVSFVTTGRNDDYMPNFPARLRVILAWNLAHAATDGVFVEWNPPGDRPLLSPDLCREFRNLRGYVVPSEVHHRVCRNANLKLMEYHAKNVGVRRAEGDFILVSNADILVGPRVCQVLRGRRLDVDTVYLSRRVDVTWNERDGTRWFLANPANYLRVLALDPIGPGDFILASRSLWERAGGYDESLQRHRLGCDGRGVLQMTHLGAEVTHIGEVFHLDHATSSLNAIRPWQGEVAPFDGIPYRNPPDWGMQAAGARLIADRVWEIQ